jgi:hypothetical protein
MAICSGQCLRANLSECRPCGSNLAVDAENIERNFKTGTAAVKSRRLREGGSSGGSHRGRVVGSQQYAMFQFQYATFQFASIAIASSGIGCLSNGHRVRILSNSAPEFLQIDLPIVA